MTGAYGRTVADVKYGFSSCRNSVYKGGFRSIGGITGAPGLRGIVIPSAEEDTVLSRSGRMPRLAAVS